MIEEKKISVVPMGPDYPGIVMVEEAELDELIADNNENYDIASEAIEQLHGFYFKVRADLIELLPKVRKLVDENERLAGLVRELTADKLALEEQVDDLVFGELGDTFEELPPVNVVARAVVNVELVAVGAEL